MNRKFHKDKKSIKEKIKHPKKLPKLITKLQKFKKT